MITDTKIVHHVECKCLSWKPIIAGALVAIGLSFLLNLFTVAIGLTAFTTNDQGVEKFMLGGMVATGLGIIVSMFASGWITGYLGKSYCVKRHLGALYGFLAWCLALILTIFLASHIQQYLSFYGHFISGTTESFQAAASSKAGVASVSTNVHPDTLVVSTYIIFSLFFLSAFASCLGGHCGMRHKCQDEIH